MKAIILAGGLGTRLKTVISEVPKPMAPINGKPFLAVLIDYLKLQNIDEIILAVHHLKHTIIDYFCFEYDGIKIVYSIEEEPLGTGGGIVKAFELINSDEPVFVLNGDTFCELDYYSMYKRHIREKTKFSMALVKVNDISRYGGVELANDNCTVNKFVEKGSPKAGLINSGIYLINKSLFKDFNLQKNFSLEIDFLQKYLMQIKPVGFETDGYFIDIGIPEEYKNFCQKKRKRNKALFLDRDGIVNHDYVHVGTIDRFEFIPKIFSLCKSAKNRGYKIIIVTNQAGIAKKKYSLSDFINLSKYMLEKFAEKHIWIDAVYFCPYHENSLVKQYKIDQELQKENTITTIEQNIGGRIFLSRYRKPHHGMIVQASNTFDIDLENSIFIGDSDNDTEAARKAGIKHVKRYDKTDYTAEGILDFT